MQGFLLTVVEETEKMSKNKLNFQIYFYKKHLLLFIVVLL